MLSGYLDARFKNVLYWGEQGNGKDDIAVGLDIGTSKIATIIGNTAI